MLAVYRDSLLALRMTVRAGRQACNAAFILIAAKRRHHHPLNQPAQGRRNLLNPLNPGRRRRPYFLATAPTARMMKTMPASCQKLKIRWKMKKERMMEERGSMAEMMLASVGRM